MMRYFPLNLYLKKKFGQRVQKIPLDAGFSCPNRDGTLSTQGCIFCNPQGSGTSLKTKGLSLKEQFSYFQAKFQKKYKAQLFLAYLQSYSNTYGPLEKIKKVLEEISSFPQLAGLCLGTRPDCLDEEKLSLIAKYHFKEVWLEIGLQSAHNRTLALINKGHLKEDFSQAVKRVHSFGFKTCVHVIAGLPQEKEKDFLQTIEFINSLPVQGIKFHNLYICANTRLADLYKEGKYMPLSLKEYVTWLRKGLESLRPDIVVHRLNGDPQPQELIAPTWAGNKQEVIKNILLELEQHDSWQGKARGTSLVELNHFLL